ncbi:MAG: hypothetical protein EOP05_10785 [Proteobacteria bacterium]|nr:MAG: hypothetical protein EOP05_10785 [Pseudomonadota bacterium]
MAKTEFDAGSPDLDVTKREAGLEQNDKSKTRITQTLRYDKNQTTSAEEDEQHRIAISEATGNRRDDNRTVDKLDRDPIDRDLH